MQMGMFMASVAFSCPDKELWRKIAPQIEEMFSGEDALFCNFQEEGPGYCIVSPYGASAALLANLPQKISTLTGGYAVFANCIDSDFNMISLWCNGENIEDSYIGNIYEEYAAFCEIHKPDVNLWIPLLIDRTKVEDLSRALLTEQILVEDNLRDLSQLTGLPIFDDEFFWECN